MEKVILIKYGELSTKKDNINFFLNKLKVNILESLKGIEARIDYDLGRMFIHTSDIDKAIERVKKVFGIHEFNICYIIESNDFEEIEECSAPVNDSTKDGFPEICDPGDLPF